MKYFEIADKNGKMKTVSKLEYIKQEMQDFLESLYMQKKGNDTRNKPLPLDFNTRIYNKLETVMLKIEKPMPNSEALSISADTFYDLYIEYCELVCFIENEMAISYHKDKAEFCRYCAITPNAFEQIRIHGDMYQIETLNNIDDNIGANLLITAGNGAIKAKPTELQLTSKSSYGHKMQTTTAKETAVVIPISENSFTPLSELAPPKMPKMLKGKKGED